MERTPRHHALPHGSFYGTPEHDHVVRGFRLRRLGADPERTVAVHTHETAHFVLPLRGPYLSTARGAPTVCDGQVVIYNPPGTTHRDRFGPTGDSIAGQFFTISVAPERMEEIRMVAPPVGEPTALRGPGPASLVRRLIRSSRSATMASRLTMEGLCLELMGEVARGTAEDRTAPRWLSAAERMIAERSAERLTVGQVAAEVGVHPVHLARGFRRWRQSSPAETLRQARLDRAVALLRETSLSLAEIALKAGFCDQSHLTRAFAASFGLTPRRYRTANAVAGRVRHVP